MLRFPERVRQALSTVALKSIGAFLNFYSRFSFSGAGRLAFLLFSHPRSRMSRDHHAELLSTARRHKKTVRDIDIHLFHWPGDGPHVFMAHGWESNASRWMPLIRALRQRGYRITAIDAPAHGYSGSRRFSVLLYAQVLKEIFEEYSPDIFVGHSAGGMAGVYCLQEKPLPCLRQMVLMAVPNELDQLMDTFRRIVGMNDRVFDGLRYSFRKRFGVPMTAFSIAKFIQDLSLPGLIIHDRDDTIAPFEGGRDIHRNWHKAQFVETEGLGHSLPGESVVEAVVQYLEANRSAVFSS